VRRISKHRGTSTRDIMSEISNESLKVLKYRTLSVHHHTHKLARITIYDTNSCVNNTIFL